jgi:serine/threonine protein phosphatase PrpC
MQVDDCEVMTFQVGPRDVLVMGSDGLLDNLGDQELVAEVADMMAAVSLVHCRWMLFCWTLCHVRPPHSH